MRILLTIVVLVLLNSVAMGQPVDPDPDGEWIPLVDYLFPDELWGDFSNLPERASQQQSGSEDSQDRQQREIRLPEVLMMVLPIVNSTGLLIVAILALLFRRRQAAGADEEKLQKKLNEIGDRLTAVETKLDERTVNRRRGPTLRATR